MSTEIDELIAAEVERSFDTEPPLRDPRQYADRGRRTQRRRRAAVGALGLGAAAVATTLVLGGSGPGASGRGIEPADTGATPVPATGPVPVDPHHAERCAAGRLGACDQDISSDDIYLDDSGRLLRGYAYDEVTGYYTDVLPHTPDPDVTLGASAAVELTVRGRTVWALLRRDVGGDSSLEFARRDPTRTFDEWVQDSVAHGAWFAYDREPMIPRTTRP